MTAVVLVLAAHRAEPLRAPSFLDLGSGRVPAAPAPAGEEEGALGAACEALTRAVGASEGALRLAVSVPGAGLARLGRRAPAVLEALRRLVDTGAVEVLTECAWNAPASGAAAEELGAQVRAHRALVRRHLGAPTGAFRTAELALDDATARRASELGCAVALDAASAEEARPLGLRRRGDLRLVPCDLDRSGELARAAAALAGATDDLARAAAEACAARLDELPLEAEAVGLVVDARALGAAPALAGELARAVLASPRLAWATPTEAARRRAEVPRAEGPVDPAALAPWLGNAMQRAVREALAEVGAEVRAAARPELEEAWRELADAEHLRALALGPRAAAAPSPHEAFVRTMNAIEELCLRARTPSGAGALSTVRQESETP